MSCRLSRPSVTRELTHRVLNRVRAACSYARTLQMTERFKMLATFIAKYLVCRCAEWYLLRKKGVTAGAVSRVRSACRALRARKRSIEARERERDYGREFRYSPRVLVADTFSASIGDGHYKRLFSDGEGDTAEPSQHQNERKYEIITSYINRRAPPWVRLSMVQLRMQKSFRCVSNRRITRH